MEVNVRSELIFRARETVDNKYKLCQTTSKATRRLHIATKNTTDTINDALGRIAGGDEFSPPVNPILASSYPDERHSANQDSVWSQGNELTAL